MAKKKQLDSWNDLPAVTTFCIPFVHCHLKHYTEVLLEETNCYSHCTSSENSREMPTFMVRPFSMLNCNTVARCKHRSHLNQNSSQSRNTERTSRRNLRDPNNEWWSCFVGRQVCVCISLFFQNAKKHSFSLGLWKHEQWLPGSSDSNIHYNHTQAAVSVLTCVSVRLAKACGSCFNFNYRSNYCAGKISL